MGEYHAGQGIRIPAAGTLPRVSDIEQDIELAVKERTKPLFRPRASATPAGGSLLHLLGELDMIIESLWGRAGDTGRHVEALAGTAPAGDRPAPLTTIDGPFLGRIEHQLGQLRAVASALDAANARLGIALGGGDL